eukprot:6194473-Pleurochrysis_carterae.AAC.1
MLRASDALKVWLPGPSSHLAAPERVAPQGSARRTLLGRARRPGTTIDSSECPLRRLGVSTSVVHDARGSASRKINESSVYARRT